MVLPLTISDPDRRIDFALAVDCTLTPGVSPRMGWRDGGSCGEGSQIDVTDVWCQELVVWCGSFPICARPIDTSVDAGAKLGRWCGREYAAEIEAEIHAQLGSRQCVPLFAAN